MLVVLHWRKASGEASSMALCPRDTREGLYICREWESANARGGKRQLTWVTRSSLKMQSPYGFFAHVLAKIKPS